MSEKEMINVIIDGRDVEVKKGTTILDAALSIGIEIPSLCYLKGINETGACRVCVVEIEGLKALQASCVYPITKPITVYTNSERVRKTRRRVVELLLSEHDRDCTTCIRNLNCELQNIADNLGIRDIRATGRKQNHKLFDNNTFIVRDYNKCILCRRCEAICSNVQGINIYSALNRGMNTAVAPAFMDDLKDTDCITCGQCVIACPTASLIEKEFIKDVWDAIEDETKYVIVQTAPSVQVTLGEIFNMKIGSIVTGKMVSALKMIGFDRVFPTDFFADLTIIEEAHELIDRMRNSYKLPLLSSCCPAWIKFAEHNYPSLLKNISSCKSPQGMFGALIKSYYADKIGINPKDIVTVSIMPCTAKKYEASRPELSDTGFQDVDYVLTTRELGRMIRQAGIDFVHLDDSEYDLPFGITTGAGTIFGSTGGVIEAAVRTAYAILNEGKKEIGVINFAEFRGQSGLKWATVDLGIKKINIAIAHGTKNARVLMDKILAGEKYDYVEVMGCPGGCVGGGGQPIHGGRDHKKTSLKYRHDRADSLYKIDEANKLRKSHKNPSITNLYNEFLGKPLGEISNRYLHTNYTDRTKNF